MYSRKVIDILQEYMTQFPQLFEYLAYSSDNTSKDVFYMDDVFPEEALENLTKLSAWLKDLPCASAHRQPCGTLTLDEDVVKALEETIDNSQGEETKKLITMQVRPHLLFKPNLCKGSSLPDESTKFHLFDRVVNVREGFSVPLGARGTVTGNLFLGDILFDYDLIV